LYSFADTISSPIKFCIMNNSYKATVSASNSCYERNLLIISPNETEAEILLKKFKEEGRYNESSKIQLIEDLTTNSKSRIISLNFNLKSNTSSGSDGDL
jgi:hypothetical protein